MFKPTGLGEKIFQERYARNSDESWEEAASRVAYNISLAEQNGKTEVVEEQFKKEIVEGYFMPGGRIWYGAGRPSSQMLNCFVIPTSDSREGWGKTISDTIVVSGMGGGVGTNYSPVRGRNYPIMKMGGHATGAVSLMRMVDGVGYELVGGGGRRLALMMALAINHPDIIEFIHGKLDLEQLENANISIIIPDDYKTEQLVDDIKNNRNIKLKFNGLNDVFDREINLAELWDKIVKNAWQCGDPGVLNGYLANQENNVSYLYKLICTNPCQPADATVLTPTGISTIGKIKIGDTIWSGKRWTKVVNKWSTGIKQVNEYHTTNGVFLGTENHRIVSRGKKIEVGSAESIDAAIGPYERYLTNVQAVMDGLVIGDGGVHKASNNLVGLYIGEKDQDYFDSHIADLIGDHRPGINPKFYEVETTIEHFELPKTYEREIPDRYFYAVPAVKASFLRGLFSANGSVINNRIALKASSFKLISQVQIMLSSLGIQSYYTVNKPTTIKFSNGDYTCRESYDLNISTDRSKFIGSIGFIQEYKNEKIKIIPTVRHETSNITEITPRGIEEVFDITVDDPDHTYWTGGLLVSNCGEIWLPAYGCCCLGALVLPRFVRNGRVDWDRLDETVRTGVRFLDNVLTMNTYPLPEIRQVCENERRIGLGVMGLHSMLMDLGMKYESPEAIEFIDKLFSKIKHSAYHASVDLAIEKGPFAGYTAEFLNSPFVKRLKPSVRTRIKEYGIRNCALLTIAPTGTTALVHNVTGGIEPLFAPVCFRRRFVKTDMAGEKKTQKTLIVSKDYLDHKELAQGAYDVSVRGHFEVQKTCQYHIDNAVSKTINLRKDFPVEELSDLWLEYLPYMKGSTFYREGSKKDEPLEYIPLEEIENVIKTWDGEIEYENETMDCPSGACEIK